MVQELLHDVERGTVLRLTFQESAFSELAMLQALLGRSFRRAPTTAAAIDQVLTRHDWGIFPDRTVMVTATRNFDAPYFNKKVGPGLEKIQT